jgi:predicted site-specific integrase-resolvase
MRGRGLSALLRVASQGLVNTVLVTHSDRLARFGLELLERLFSGYHIALEVVHKKAQTIPQGELVTDLMALIASFSG